MMNDDDDMGEHAITSILFFFVTQDVSKERVSVFACVCVGRGLDTCCGGKLTLVRVMERDKKGKMRWEWESTF